MNVIARDLFTKLGTACFQVPQATEASTSKKLHRQIAGMLHTTFVLWGIKDSGRRDPALQQEMCEFWYQALQACMPESTEMLAECPQDIWISNAVRIHSVFLAVAHDPTLTLHADEALFYAQALDELCKALLEKEREERRKRTTVEKFPKRPRSPSQVRSATECEVVSMSSFIARQRRKR